MADRYLLETGAPDGYQLEDGSGVLILEDEAAAPSTGWLSTLSVVSRRASVIALAGGLVFVPAPPAAPASVAAWGQPLSKAAPQRPLIRSDLRPFGVTVAAAAAAPEGWQPQTSRAAPRPPAGPGGPSYTFLSTQFTQNTATYQGYQQPLSRPAPRPPVQIGQIGWVGQPLAGNNVDLSKWQQPLGKAAASPPVWQGNAFVPFDTAQIAVPTPSQVGWYRPLSVAAPRPAVWQGNSFVPFDTAQVVANFYGWWQPASRAPDPRPQIRSELKPFGVQLYDNNVTIDKWQQPLSKAVPIPRYQVGNTFVPFNTAQAVVAAADVYGWWQPLAGAAKRRGQAGQQRVAIAYPTGEVGLLWAQKLYTAPPRLGTPQPELRPFGVQLVAAAAPPNGWWVDLSRAVPRPPVWQGASFVPFDTAQVVAANYGWWQPASRAAPRPPVWQGGPSYTFLSTQFTQNTVYWGNYQQPLAGAPAARPVWQGGEVWVGRPLAGNNVDWANYQQPLSKPAPRPPVWQGSSLVPFDTAQITTPTPGEFGWYSPLSTTGTRTPGQIAVTLLGWTFVPWDTVQVIPPPPVGGVQPPGFWYEQWELIAKRQGKRKKPAPELLIAVDEIPPDWQPSKVFKVSPAVIEALAQARSIDDIRELARQETGQVRNMLNMLIAEYKRRVRDEDDIEVILIMT